MNRIGQFSTYELANDAGIELLSADISAKIELLQGTTHFADQREQVRWVNQPEDRCRLETVCLPSKPAIRWPRLSFFCLRSVTHWRVFATCSHDANPERTRRKLQRC